MNQKIAEFGWWIEIVTIKPICIYYFGAFDCLEEAIQAKSGYMEDLAQEAAEIINVDIKQCQPKNLTIFLNRPETVKVARVLSLDYR